MGRGGGECWASFKPAASFNPSTMSFEILPRYSVLPFLERTEVILYPSGQRLRGKLRLRCSSTTAVNCHVLQGLPDLEAWSCSPRWSSVASALGPWDGGWAEGVSSKRIYRSRLWRLLHQHAELDCSALLVKAERRRGAQKTQVRAKE